MSQRSFTLIEMLVTVSIILLLSGVALASYARFNTDKNLEKELDHVNEIIQQAKQMAQAPRKTGVCQNNFEYVAVGFSGLNNHTVTTYVFCRTIVGQYEQINTYELPATVSDVTVKLSDSAGFGTTTQLMAFKPLTPDLYTAPALADDPAFTVLPAGSTVQIKLKSSTGNLCGFLAINVVGSIKKQNRVDCNATMIPL